MVPTRDLLIVEASQEPFVPDRESATRSNPAVRDAARLALTRLPAKAVAVHRTPPTVARPVVASRLILRHSFRSERSTMVSSSQVPLG